MMKIGQHQAPNKSFGKPLYPSVIFEKVVESMIGKVERTALIVDNVDLEKNFEDYCEQCENIFE